MLRLYISSTSFVGMVQCVKRQLVYMAGYCLNYSFNIVSRAILSNLVNRTLRQ